MCPSHKNAPTNIMINQTDKTKFQLLHRFVSVHLLPHILHSCLLCGIFFIASTTVQDRHYHASNSARSPGNSPPTTYWAAYSPASASASNAESVSVHSLPHILHSCLLCGIFFIASTTVQDRHYHASNSVWRSTLGERYPIAPISERKLPNPILTSIASPSPAFRPK